MLVLVVVAGFPVALLLGWVFGLQGGEITRTAPLSGTADAETGRRAALIILDAVWPERRGGRAGSRSGAQSMRDLPRLPVSVPLQSLRHPLDVLGPDLEIRCVGPEATVLEALEGASRLACAHHPPGVEASAIGDDHRGRPRRGFRGDPTAVGTKRVEGGRGSAGGGRPLSAGPIAQREGERR